MPVHRLKSLGCVIVLAALSSISSVASSQPVLSSDEAAKLADAYFSRGKNLLKEGNIKAAYKEYKAAWDLKKSYDIAANLGNVEYELGMPRDAAEHLAFSVRNAAVSVTRERLEKMKKVLDLAKALVGAMVVRVNIDGAEILIDGETIGRSPIVEELYLDPGPRTIEARLAGHETAKKIVEFPRASTRMVYLELKPIPARPAPTASITAPPPPPPPRPRPRKNLVPLGVGAGVAVASLGVGITSLFVSNAKSDAAADLRAKLAGTPPSDSSCYPPSPHSEQCEQLDSDYVAAGSFRNASIIGFMTAGLATMATVTYALIPPSAPAVERRVRAAFGVGPRGGGLTIEGRF
jgi:hypothetical protein